jgi:thiol-disulfide isomerase/thioredoxin
MTSLTCSNATTDSQLISEQTQALAVLLKDHDENPEISEEEQELAWLAVTKSYYRGELETIDLGQTARRYMVSYKDYWDASFYQLRKEVIELKLAKFSSDYLAADYSHDYSFTALPLPSYDLQVSLLVKSEDEDSILAQQTQAYTLKEMLTWFGIEECSDDRDCLQLFAGLILVDGTLSYCNHFLPQDQNLGVSLSADVFFSNFDSDHLNTQETVAFTQDTAAWDNKKFPDFMTATDPTSGEIVSLWSEEDHEGKTTIINFWATWCSPCKKKRPLLEEFAQTRKDSVDVINVSVDEDLADVREYIAKHNGVARDLWDANLEIKKMLRINRLPMTLVIDSKGKMHPVSVKSLDELDKVCGIVQE